MANDVSYKIPEIIVETREELINLLNQLLPKSVFYSEKEVTNPVSIQWDKCITAQISSEELGLAIIKYKESVYEKNSDELIDFLKAEYPNIKNIYKGTIKP